MIIVSLLALVAGLILRLTSGWFHAQHTVGDILLWVSAISFIILFLAIALAGWIVSSKGSTPRRRRGF